MDLWRLELELLLCLLEPRERAIMTQLLWGHTLTEIATSLNLDVSRVRAIARETLATLRAQIKEEQNYGQEKGRQKGRQEIGEVLLTGVLEVDRAL